MSGQWSSVQIADKEEHGLLETGLFETRCRRLVAFDDLARKIRCYLESSRTLLVAVSEQVEIVDRIAFEKETLVSVAAWKLDADFDGLWAGGVRLRFVGQLLTKFFLLIYNFLRDREKDRR